MPTANEILGRVLISLGRLPEAAEAYRRELAINPDDAGAAAVLGWLYLKEKRYEEAAPLLSAAADLGLEDPGLLFLSAQIDAAYGEFEAAARKLEQFTVKNPDDRAARVLLARAYAKLGRREDFNREKEIIRRLTEAEQRRNLLPGKLDVTDSEK